jgi:branched-chain amino acid transport system substrate-binding protein
MFGGAMVGLQATALKNKLKSHLNGVVNYDNWVPAPKMMAPAADFFKKYQARAPGIGIDPLGYYLGGWGYARMQLLADAVTGTKSLDDGKLADYMRSHTFNTIMIDGIKFGKNGEWVTARQLQVQYRGLTDAANLETWRGMSYQTVLAPPSEVTGAVIYPYEKALS